MTLYELTGKESGAIVYDGDDNTAYIVNWASVDGLPRWFEPVGWVGLGEEIIATEIEPPDWVIDAMRQHEVDAGVDLRDSKDDYRAWRVNDRAIVVINRHWI